MIKMIRILKERRLEYSAASAFLAWSNKFIHDMIIIERMEI
jgi:hypothetical protein